MWYSLAQLKRLVKHALVFSFFSVSGKLKSKNCVLYSDTDLLDEIKQVKGAEQNCLVQKVFKN